MIEDSYSLPARHVYILQISIMLPSFNEKNIDLRILCQAPGYYAARCTTTETLVSYNSGLRDVLNLTRRQYSHKCRSGKPWWYEQVHTVQGRQKRESKKEALTKAPAIAMHLNARLKTHRRQRRGIPPDAWRRGDEGRGAG